MAFGPNVRRPVRRRQAAAMTHFRDYESETVGPAWIGEAASALMSERPHLSGACTTSAPQATDNQGPQQSLTDTPKMPSTWDTYKMGPLATVRRHVRNVEVGGSSPLTSTRKVQVRP